MIGVIRGSWALFLGVLLLMLGNALQGSLLGVRSAIENFPVEIYGYVSAAYFAGFLGGSWLTPIMLRRVGHIRVFAALGSLISAAFIIYAALVDPYVWMAMRLLVGFCFSGVYIVVESWLNDAATNETRGKALSAYMFTQYLGIVLGQQALNLGDPAGFELFVLISVLVSVSFAPILLSVAPAPVFQTSKPMTIRELLRASPLGSVGCFLLGGVFGAMFGMSALYGKRVGLSLAELSLFLTAMYAGAVFLQIPIGWLSDRMDRRFLVIVTAIGASAACLLAIPFGLIELGVVGGVRIFALYIAAFIAGGLANPIYALLLAHTNDFLEHEQMASASGGLVFLNGVGALSGPVIVGYLMTSIGDDGFWAFMSLLLLGLAVFGLYRATQRPTVDETGPFAPIGIRVTPVAVEMLNEHVIDQIEAAHDADERLDKADEGERRSSAAADTS